MPSIESFPEMRADINNKKRVVKLSRVNLPQMME
jgi:hypothetical protein